MGRQIGQAIGVGVRRQPARRDDRVAHPQSRDQRIETGVANRTADIDDDRPLLGRLDVISRDDGRRHDHGHGPRPEDIGGHGDHRDRQQAGELPVMAVEPADQPGTPQVCLFAQTKAARRARATIHR